MHIFEYLVLHWWIVGGRIRGCGLAEGGVSLHWKWAFAGHFVALPLSFSSLLWYLRVSLGCKLSGAVSGPCWLACHHAANHDARGL